MSIEDGPGLECDMPNSSDLHYKKNALRSRLPVLILKLFIILCISACSIDVMGLFVSSYVNDRFESSQTQPEIPAPELTDSENFSFLVIADPHYDDKPLKFINDLIEADYFGASLIFFAGDIVQDGRQSAYDLAQSEIDRLEIPVYHIIGNHDIYYSGYEIYKETFGRTVYSLLIGETLFIILDTANGTLGKNQREWLENQLKRTDYLHSFVISHYGIVSPGFQKFVEWSLIEEKYDLIDLFDHYDLDYFISGHLHLNESLYIREVHYETIGQVSDSEEPVLLKIQISGTQIKKSLIFLP